MKYLISLSFLLTIFLSCSTNRNTIIKDSPNILLIVSEDNGPELGCYGVEEVTTPNLDRLAENGILFKNAYVTYSVCSPSRGTIYTGLYPHQNGQIGLATHNFRMYEGIETLPSFLKTAGYRTGCIGKIHVNPKNPMDWDFRPGGLLNGSNFGKRNMSAYSEYADTFMMKDSAPFFLMVNYPDAHFPLQRDVEGLPTVKVDAADIDSALPFVGADSERLRDYTANYYNSMNRLDEAVGMLLDRLDRTGKRKNTIIIYLGDHGAQFSRGKCSNYEGGLKIPFIIEYPRKVKSGQDRDELISTVDLLPTIFDIAGIEIPEMYPGLSLVPFFNGKRLKSWRNYIYAGGTGSAAHFYFPRRSIRDERYKLIHNLDISNPNPHPDKYENHYNSHFSGGTEREVIDRSQKSVREAYDRWKYPPEFELYDLLNDPWEFTDLSSDPDHHVILEKLKGALKTWQIETSDPLINPEVLVKLREEYRKHAETKPRFIVWEYPEYFGFEKKQSDYEN